MLSLVGNWMIIPFILVLEVWAASVMASRKGRSRGWAVLTLFFQPALLVLWALPSRKMPAQAALKKCPACGGDVSSEATACPHCGHPQTTSRRIRRKGYFVEAAGLIVLLGALVFFVLDVLKNYGAILPTCDSQTAQSDAKETMADGPLFKLKGLHIIALREITTISRSHGEVKCRAVALLNDTTKHQISYRFYNDHDSVFVEAHLDDPQ